MAGNGNPNSLANLRPPYKKGQSGNRKGAPKKLIKIETWREFADESAGPDKNGAPLPSRERLAMLAVFKCATDTRRKDCTAAQRIFFDRVQGRVPDTLQLRGSINMGENPIETLLDGMIARKAQEETVAESGSEPSSDEQPSES